MVAAEFLFIGSLALLFAVLASVLFIFWVMVFYVVFDGLYTAFRFVRMRRALVRRFKRNKQPPILLHEVIREGQTTRVGPGVPWNAEETQMIDLRHFRGDINTHRRNAQRSTRLEDADTGVINMQDGTQHD